MRLLNHQKEIFSAATSRMAGGQFSPWRDGMAENRDENEDIQEWSMQEKKMKEKHEDVHE